MLKCSLLPRHLLRQRPRKHGCGSKAATPTPNLSLCSVWRPTPRFDSFFFFFRFTLIHADSSRNQLIRSNSGQNGCQNRPIWPDSGQYDCQNRPKWPLAAILLLHVALRERERRKKKMRRHEKMVGT